MTANRRVGPHDSMVVGRAETVGEVLPLGSIDPVIAARAVRRALAAARRRATDVDTIVVATPPPLTIDRVSHFARRALGAHGTEVRQALLEADGTGASLAERALRDAPGGAARSGVIVAVGIGADGTTVALCVERRAPTELPG